MIRGKSDLQRHVGVNFMNPDMLRFADDFENRRDFFLLVGGTGLGKTHLSTSVAKSLIDNGYDVVYEIAQNIFSDFESDRFRDRFSDEEPISNKYFECDLLIIDDLGTEIITANSVSYLYNIIATVTILPFSRPSLKIGTTVPIAYFWRVER